MTRTTIQKKARDVLTGANLRQVRPYGLYSPSGGNALLCVFSDLFFRFATIALFFERPLGILAAQDREHDDETYELRNSVEQRERAAVKSAAVRCA